MATPPLTARLRFREMTEADLDDMAELLGDPVVMQYYQAPKSRAAEPRLRHRGCRRLPRVRPGTHRGG